MLEIDLKKIGKRFNYEWVFRGLEGQFASGDGIAILGGNGSGKSTLLKSIFGYAPLSEGTISYAVDQALIKPSAIYRYFSICTPYLELYEELTLTELINFHFSLKPALPEISRKEIPDILDLKKAESKQIKFFSSGMKQRVRIGLAMLSDVKGIFLDEPTSNLDRKAIEWYQTMINTYGKDRILFVASNQQKDEYFFCTKKIEIENFKPH
jgi:ABC-type multidrug transport system ATPase subunit